MLWQMPLAKDQTTLLASSNQEQIYYNKIQIELDTTKKQS
jgi:hypothetical protein